MANSTVYPYGTNGTLPSSIGLINDITTGGADKALAAQQGVVLKGLIDEAQYDAIPLDIFEFGQGVGCITSSNKWTQTTTTGAYFVERAVSPGEKYVILANSDQPSYYAFLTNIDYRRAGGTPYYVAGTTRYTISHGEQEIITIPEGCAYLYITIGNSGVDATPQGLTFLREKIERNTDTAAQLNTLEGTWDELWDYETAEVFSNSTSNITIEKVDGEIIVNNVSSAGSKYALIKLPSTLSAGKTYTFTVNHSSNFTYAASWWLGFVNSSYQPTSGGFNLHAFINETLTITHTMSANDKFFRLASTSQNTGAYVDIHSISISEYKTTVSNLATKVTALESGQATKGLENMLKQARYVSSSVTTQPLTLMHFSDIHGDTAAANTLYSIYEKYNTLINDMVLTGDAVYYYWDDSGQGYQWFQDSPVINSLFVLGNHDGAANSNEHGWKENSADWDFKGKEWDFDNYFADYITARGVTPPEGYDDSSSPYYKACYWHKDYSSAKIRVFGIDCMHFNDGVRYTSDDQETWLAEKLAETLTSGNSAYGYSCVFLSHYPLDDFDGMNETWNDSTHKFVYNQNATGGALMNENTAHQVTFMNGTSFTAEKKFSMRDRVGTVGSTSYSKGPNNPIGDVIQAWIDEGGKFLVWLSGHTHTEYMYYPAKFPTMLCVGLPQAGNTRGNGQADRSDSSPLHCAANIYTFDTQNNLFKVIRVGKTTDKQFRDLEVLCYNYSTKTVIR